MQSKTDEPIKTLVWQQTREGSKNPTYRWDCILTWGHLANISQCQYYIYIAHNRKASNALCTLVKWEKKFSGPSKDCQRNVTDVAGSLVTSTRPLGRLKKRPDDRTSNSGVAVRTADGSRRAADAADEQCLRCGCSSSSCTVVPCTAWQWCGLISNDSGHLLLLSPWSFSDASKIPHVLNKQPMSSISKSLSNKSLDI